MNVDNHFYEAPHAKKQAAQKNVAASDEQVNICEARETIASAHGCVMWNNRTRCVPKSNCVNANLLRIAEQTHVTTPLVVICGKNQMQTNPKPTTFDPTGRTVMST